MNTIDTDITRDSTRKEFARDLILAGYQKHKLIEEQQILNKHELEHDFELSQPKSRVYKHKNKSKAYVVYPGTKDLNDVVTDTVLLVGTHKYTPRFKEAKRVAKKVNRKYGYDNVTAIGHSLGGSLAEESGIKNVLLLIKE